MFARLHSFDLGAEELGSAAEIVEQILPTVRGLDGYRGLFVLSDLNGNRIISVSLWETSEKMDASLKVTEKIRAAETANREVESQDPSTYRVVAFDLSD
ncbi:MAG: hypothetical protein M3P42_00300 [Actinomycetota bacterium]|nr:hypothetical protein [Actinomycetota bacterium]